jgi:hypothetical protein
MELCAGGLEPAFRVLFSTIFHGIASGNCHQGRKWRILAEAKRGRDIRRANLGGSLTLPVSRRWPRSPNSRHPPSTAPSIFWIQASIGIWPSGKSVAWSGLGFQSGIQVVGVEILNLSKRFRKLSKRWLCMTRLTPRFSANRTERYYLPVGATTAFGLPINVQSADN